MKLPAVIPQGFLKALPPAERARLGRTGMTRQECETHIVYEQEKALQRLCAQWLTLHDIYFEADRMDRRTSGKCGRADFRICHHGHWLSCECKVAGQPLTQAQEREADRLRNSGGVFVVVRELGDLTEALAALEALEGS
jgi:hypothetical protein